MIITIPQVAQYAAYLLLLIIAGGLEYLKLLPVGTVGGLFLLIVGHFFGNTPTVAALNQNTAAMKENTAGTTANVSQAPQGPLHVVLHNEAVAVRTSAHPNPIDEPTAAPAPPEPQPIILPTSANRSVPDVPAVQP